MHLKGKSEKMYRGFVVCREVHDGKLGAALTLHSYLRWLKEDFISFGFLNNGVTEILFRTRRQKPDVGSTLSSEVLQVFL